MGEVEVVAMDSVVGHQQPARQALFNVVKMNARRRLGQLRDLQIKKVIEGVA